MTVLVLVAVVGAKIPLVCIAAGKTGRVGQSQVGNVDGHWRIHSVGSWETLDTFQDDHAKLRSAMGETPTQLLLDCYSAHGSEPVKQAAAKLGISLHFIPPGLTDEFQPFDRVVFAVLKAQAKHFFHARFHLNPRQRRTI
jgi:hypothetical protein